jgi:organic radical activating enzyme
MSMRFRALHVQRVMLTGGEPLLHRNLWALCKQLQALGIRITLVTTGLLIDRHAADIAASVDTVVISLDGDREIHDAIRRVKGGFDRIACGVTALRGEHPAPRLIARSVVQRGNCGSLYRTIVAAHDLGFDEVSFLAADLSSSAFNRVEPWSAERIRDVAVGVDELPALEAAIELAAAESPQLMHDGFIVGGPRVARSNPPVLPGRRRSRRIPKGRVQRAVGISCARARRQPAAVFLSSRLRFRGGRSRGGV